MKKLIVIVLITFISCDSIVYKNPLPTYAGENLTTFPKEYIGVYTNKNIRTDTLFIGKTSFVYEYKDGEKYKKIIGTIGENTTAKKYKTHFFVSRKLNDYWLSRKLLLIDGKLTIYNLNSYEKDLSIIKNTVFDYSYDKRINKHLLKPTNSELDKLIQKNAFKQDRIFIKVNNTQKNTTGCLLGNCNNGEGKIKYSNGDIYLGYFKNGLRDGLGEYIWSNGDTYIGDWNKGYRKGDGTLKWSNGNKYTGSFINNKRLDGVGIFTWKNGTKYEGNFVNEMMHGYGIIFYASGGKFSGYFIKDKRHGKGKLYDKNGVLLYDSIWEQDKKISN